MVAAAVSAAAPTANTPSCKIQQLAQAARAAPATVAVTSVPSPAVATAVPLPPQPATTVESLAHSKVILSFQKVARRDTLSPRKKTKVEMPSDSDPATPEVCSFTLLSQLDRADLDFQSLTPPTPEPALLGSKNSLECDMWTTVRPSR